jgi:hypothetical protein
MKSSRLRFLTHAEMSSSALWTAQFLAAGVMMRVSGGRKRLYVTQREAYMQQSTAPESSWTWQRLRQLPRFSLDLDSHMEGNDECQPGVAEADAKESCWAHYPAYDDTPASVTTSFSSSHSAQQLTIRPAGPRWPRSITPTSILKNKPPISPLSEFPAKRPNQQRPRTVSASHLQNAPLNASKRRLVNSFDHAGQGPSDARPISTGDYESTSAPTSKPKRRRLTHSPSPRPTDAQHQAQALVWANNTPRRSREPPSPFFSSHPELPRTSSDVTSRSQRSVGVAGKHTPFAYATPHSGTLVGGHAGLRMEFFGEDGDTEVDEGGSGSWHGVGGDEEDEDSDSDADGDRDAVGGAEIGEEADSSGEDSGFATEEDGLFDDGDGE